MPYEDDYKMWLENMLIESNPDWVCDEMHDTEVTHDWCYKYCGKDDLYITPKCLHMYYHHIVRADRKTESDSEKPNNSTISKMEQVEDEPTEITYQNCSDALLKMWMDNVLTDAEFNRIIDKLNNAQRKDEPSNSEKPNNSKERSE